jgi:hypothetical protein
MYIQRLKCLTKVVKAFQFNDQLYNDFKKVASAEGYTKKVKSLLNDSFIVKHRLVVFS